jgi:feruloyl esterase
MKRIVLAGMMAALAGGACAWADGTSCEALAKLSLPNTDITGATLVEKGAFTPPPNPFLAAMMANAPGRPAGNQGAGGPGGPGAPAGPGGPGAGGGGRGGQNAVYKTLPAFCRLTATVHTSSDSETKYEVWLPVEGWNGRVAEFGNGGFQSFIMYGNLASALAEGYVVSANNTGHEGNNGDSIIGHPEKLKDWGYRAVHETVVAAKAVAASYYGSPVKYSYYDGCSTGGRQGWVAAEYYPNDFDGLAIGDPANPMTRLQAGSIWTNETLNKTEAGFVPAAKWTLLQNAVLDECDAKDGLKDGVIEDPMACHFDPDTLLCKNGDAPDCLTAAQIDTVTKIADGARNPRTGEQIYPGWPMGTRMFPGPVTGNKQGAPPQQDAIDTFRVLFQKSDWDYHTMDFDKDIALSDKLGNTTMNAADQTKLKPLFAKGGKLLLYHGWADGAITPLIQVQYYESTVKADGGLAKANNDVRLFMILMGGHCPNVFDKLQVISDWVEKGKAPDAIVATHAIPGKPDSTRPLCPYPQIAKYTGTGSIDEAQNFVCAAE